MPRTASTAPVLSWLRPVAFPFLACAPLLSACDTTETSDETPADFENGRAERFELVQGEFHEDMRKTLKCDNVSLSYLFSEQGEGWTYDIYSVQGCGQKTNAHLKSKGELGARFQYSFRAVPSEEELDAESTKAARETAHAVLECGVVDVAREGELSPGHASYTTKITAIGCDNTAAFNMRCIGAGYSGGRHEFFCMRVD